MEKYKKVSILLMFLVSFTSYTQNNIEISGKIFAFKSTPLNKVSEVSKSLKNTVFTDSYGVFKIDMAKKDVLIFSAIGFQTYSLKLKTIQK